MRQKNPELVYLLDRKRPHSPGFNWANSLLFAAVLGDSGRLYVAPDTIPIYREALPYATIITPNWFEVECVVQIQLFCQY